MWGEEPETETGVGPGHQSGFTSGGLRRGPGWPRGLRGTQLWGSRRVGASLRDAVPAARSGHLRPGRQPVTLPKD